MKYLGILAIVAFMAAPTMGQWVEDFAYADGPLQVVAPSWFVPGGSQNGTYDVIGGDCDVESLGHGTYASSYAANFHGAQTGNGDMVVVRIDLMDNGSPNPGNFWWMYFQNVNDWEFFNLMCSTRTIQVKCPKGMRLIPAAMTGPGVYDRLVLVVDFFRVGPSKTGTAIGYWNGTRITSPNDSVAWVRRNHSSMQHINQVRLKAWDRGVNGSGTIGKIEYLAPPVLDCDIMAGADPNLVTVNLQGKGRLPIEIYSTGGVGADEINLDTLSVEGLSCSAKSAGPNQVNIKVSRRDLLQATGLAPDETMTITVTGNLLDGTPFSASDDIVGVARED